MDIDEDVRLTAIWAGVVAEEHSLQSERLAFSFHALGLFFGQILGGERPTAVGALAQHVKTFLPGDDGENHGCFNSARAARPAGGEGFGVFPTPQAVVEKILDFANVRKSDAV